jgi:hypothetical protein
MCSSLAQAVLEHNIFKFFSEDQLQVPSSHWGTLILLLQLPGTGAGAVAKATDAAVGKGLYYYHYN